MAPSSGVEKRPGGRARNEPADRAAAEWFEQGWLMNRGCALADSALCAHVLDVGVRAGKWPEPEVPLA
jgi:hypothetical protein